jgi:hypothetical protein
VPLTNFDSTGNILTNISCCSTNNCNFYQNATIVTTTLAPYSSTPTTVNNTQLTIVNQNLTIVPTTLAPYSSSLVNRFNLHLCFLLFVNLMF